MSKPKVGFYWCASCGGCEEAVVDLAEEIFKVVELVDIVFWPCAMDFKREDVEAMADGEMAACFINGAVRTSEQREMSELCRRKSALVTKFTNTGDSPLTLSALDGLAKIEPYGGKLDWSLKNMGRTLEGWMGVYHADDTLNLPFY